MMKFALVLVALVGLSNAALKEDIREITALIPASEIRAITEEYAANDEEVQRVIAYLRGDDFGAILKAIRDTVEWQEFVAYLDAAGLDVYELIETFYELFGISNTRYNAAPVANLGVERGFHDWWRAVSALIPFSEIRALINEKLETSAEFRELAAILKSDDFQAVVLSVYNTPAWQSLLEKGRDHGAPVDAWLDILYGIFGWSRE